MEDPGGQPFDLAPIQLVDQTFFNTVFGRLKQPLSDYSFANTFVWGTSLKLYYARIDHHLCVFANGTGDLTMLMPPLPEPAARGADLRDALGRCFQIMDDYNASRTTVSRSRIEYVSDEMLEAVSSATGRGLTLSATASGGDYVYDTARMIDLAGGPLKTKRHARSSFMRNFPGHAVEPLEARHLPDCLDLLDIWQDHGDDTHRGEVTTDTELGTNILRQNETLACRCALENFSVLGLGGMALLVDGKLVGFTLGHALSPSQSSILFEKTHPEYKGAAQFIFSEFCRLHWADLPECNAGDDWGIPSLRFTKSSYRPMRMLSKYVLTRQPHLVTAGFSPSDLPYEPPRHMVGAVEMDPAQTAKEKDEAILMRLAEVADLPALVELEGLCFRTPEEMFNRRQLRGLILNPRAVVTVAELNGRVVGWSVGLVRKHRFTQSGRLYALAVHPGCQGRGIGARLASRMMEKLADKGIINLYLEVRADNTSALRLYKQLGFADHQHLPNYYAPRQNAIRMKLRVGKPAANACEQSLFDDSGETEGAAEPATLRSR